MLIDMVWSELPLGADIPMPTSTCVFQRQMIWALQDRSYLPRTPSFLNAH
jgi:hypothetical protein